GYGWSIPRQTVPRPSEAPATTGRPLELVRHALSPEPPARAASGAAQRGRRVAPWRHPLGCRIRARSTLELLGRLPHQNRGPPDRRARRRRLLERLGNSRGSRADARGPPTPRGGPRRYRELSTASGCPSDGRRAAGELRASRVPLELRRRDDDGPAREAEPQVHPRVADAQALLASAALWFRVLHRVEMVARRHGPLSFCRVRVDGPDRRGCNRSSHEDEGGAEQYRAAKAVQER